MIKYDGHLTGYYPVRFEEDHNDINYKTEDSFDVPNLPKMHFLQYKDNTQIVSRVELQVGQNIDIISKPPSSKQPKICSNVDFHTINHIPIKRKCEECFKAFCYKKCKFGFEYVNWSKCGYCDHKQSSLNAGMRLYIAGFGKYDTPLKVGISSNPIKRCISDGYSFVAMPEIPETINYSLLFSLPIAAFLEMLLPIANSRLI